ncbi:MAG: ATP-binding protein, partial [Candidatus Methanomethylophilaceae archaeon]|nr:ATP-binding protein [Candidatus Methanomethylophilaceae archaeon]
YRISFLGDRIVSETLYHSPNGRSVLVFSRGEDEDRIDPGVREKLTSSTTYLYMAAGYNNPVCNTVLRGIQSIQVIYQPSDGSVSESYYAAERDPEIRSMMEAAMEAADLGIKGFRGTERQLPFKQVPGLPDRSGRYLELEFIHSHEGADADDDMQTFPVGIESNGTVELFTVMGPISRALKDGGTVVIDEFGSDLHPMLTRWIVNLFNGRENDRGAQLIVNTHDIGLMDIDGFLRRDEIWFTDKDRDTGASSLSSLSDFNGVKKNSNVLKDYLMGRFDGIPALIGVRKL